MSSVCFLFPMFHLLFYNEVLNWLMWRLWVSRKNSIEKEWWLALGLGNHILWDRQQRGKYKGSDDLRQFLRLSVCQTLNILTPVKENKEGSFLQKGLGIPVYSKDIFSLSRYLMHKAVILSTAQSFWGAVSNCHNTGIRTQVVLLLKIFIYFDSIQTR